MKKLMKVVGVLLQKTEEANLPQQQVQHRPLLGVRIAALRPEPYKKNNTTDDKNRPGLQVEAFPR